MEGAERPDAWPDATLHMDDLERALAVFAAVERIRSKGAISVVLVVTDHARTLGLPLDAGRLLTENQGQVLGLGKGKVQQILGRHGIDRVLAEEGGRTSRGSLRKMSAYVEFLNDVYAQDEAVNLDRIEAFWINKVREFFAAKPFILHLDANASLRTAFKNLFDQAAARQQEMQGTMVVGTMLQHLVGAKLQATYPLLQHHSASTKDEGQSRPGDFAIGDLAIHVSTAPGEALIRKCQVNLSGGQRPIILTIGRGLSLATGLAENANILDRVDVFDIQQWLAAGIIDGAGDSTATRLDALSALISRYNEVIETVETDPSLKIELATGKV